jgi:hypothetical protein
LEITPLFSRSCPARPQATETSESPLMEGRSDETQQEGVCHCQCEHLPKPWAVVDSSCRSLRHLQQDNNTHFPSHRLTCSRLSSLLPVFKIHPQSTPPKSGMEILKYLSPTYYSLMALSSLYSLVELYLEYQQEYQFCMSSYHISLQSYTEDHCMGTPIGDRVKIAVHDSCHNHVDGPAFKSFDLKWATVKWATVRPGEETLEEHGACSLAFFEKEGCMGEPIREFGQVSLLKPTAAFI